MTLSLPTNAKSVAAIAALAWTALTFGAALTPAPAHAGETGAFYRAELAAPAAEARPIAAGVAWFCNDDSCAATKGTSRPVIVCARLVKEVGPVASFTAGGEALDAEQLAKCNGQ
ncbi:MAG: CC_3452 family protein [Tsuneonella sp.]